MPTFEIQNGEILPNLTFEVTRETIRAFGEASLDLNPLHFDDNYMSGSFGKTRFDGVIAHGMTGFALITRLLTEWLEPRQGIHRRLETRWFRPVKPGDVLNVQARIAQIIEKPGGRWVVFDIEINNQRDETVAKGEAMAEIPAATASRIL